MPYDIEFFYKFFLRQVVDRPEDSELVLHGPFPQIAARVCISFSNITVTRNQLIAHPLYLSHYIEKAGTGTLDMITYCKAAGLPEPGFEQRGGQFVVTFWRNWLIDEVLAEPVVSERQIIIIRFMKKKGKIPSSDILKLMAVSRQSAYPVLS